ncbi:hypothetical protein [Staphylococcus intermedius]|uniref:Uncharacterized protein n=1 Tax=Staphylococcus intermedius NCTC 11048 TaxID=1141106 RepID=A0A380G5W6_STAIN|nr:hypothetical protein [Staphylococcus intermedius]PCF64705.1 hypothetical protein B5C04_01285 [Staphylococcus intermedius]PCF80315.1 hypothetical protein B4W74_01300 [Staphylococcus intermedius]PCF81665.1 hypothetical protein B4W70_01285 [Staphylococcus intermedius]PCF88002.1 hypothetical protein B4W75_04330 [Staphylococcus intermedius]PCF88715.1 hypothetical protein B4W76_00325 [Staphylococcus intermedius]
MTDIIPFPKLKEKLIQDITEAFDKEQYEHVYDHFNAYERHFELTSELAVLKCDVLWQLGAYLELKEEANILMMQGFPPYDTFIVYYIKSLYALEQYKATVEMVEQVLDEVDAHETRMILLPFKNQAQSKLDERQDYMLHRLQRFTELSHYDQTQLVLTLIDDRAYQFGETMAYLLVHEPIVSSVQSLMLEYLRFAEYNQRITVDKNFRQIQVIPATLPGIEETVFRSQLLPTVIDALEVEIPALAQEAYILLNTNNVMLYPVNILDYGTVEMWREAYIAYFHQLMGNEVSVDSSHIEIFKLIKSLNT